MFGKREGRKGYHSGGTAEAVLFCDRLDFLYDAVCDHIIIGASYVSLWDEESGRTLGVVIEEVVV